MRIMGGINWFNLFNDRSIVKTKRGEKEVFMAFVVKHQQTAPVAQDKDGTYRATVSAIRQFSNTYGLRIGFEVTVQGGQFDGATVMRSTAPQLTKQSKLAQVIEGVLGRELTAKEIGAGFDLEQLIDMECNILVLQSKSKAGAVYSNVERVFNN